MNLTPWDIQCKQIFTIDGVSPTLWAGESRFGGGEVFVLIEDEDDIPEGDRLTHGEQPSGELLRTGCI